MLRPGLLRGVLPTSYPWLPRGEPRQVAGITTQPQISRYERYEEDHGRRLAWEAYSLGASTKPGRNTAPPAHRRRLCDLQETSPARPRPDYIYQDPYYAPILKRRT